jgi:hypothetical protein
MLKNEMIGLFYNEIDHTLLIGNGESGCYIRKVEMDLYRDTLFVNVYKQLIIGKPTSIINSASTKWKIKLEPNVGFVRLGNVLTPLSEMNKYPDEDLIYTYYPAIEVFPQKFPYVAE